MGASSTVTDHGSTIMEALLLSKILVHLVILHGYPKTGNTISFQILWSSRYTTLKKQYMIKKRLRQKVSLQNQPIILARNRKISP